MPSFAVHALLHDSVGSILLVRRKGSLIWGLPGGEIRNAEQMGEMLTTLCARQIGIRPDFFGPFERFTLAGLNVVVGVEQIVPGRAAPRGKVEAVHWMKAGVAPGEFEPTARMAIAVFRSRTQHLVPGGRGGLPELVTFRNSKPGLQPS